MFVYRGKRLDNGEWVYGYYFKTPLTNEATGSAPEDGWFFLTGRERHCISQDGCVYEVDPATVGIYWGQEDSDGDVIYTGDKVRVEIFDFVTGKRPVDRVVTVEFRDGKFGFFWGEHCPSFTTFAVFARDTKFTVVEEVEKDV